MQVYKVRGKLSILNDNKVREITVNSGDFTGDSLFVFELSHVLERMEKRGEPIGYTGYIPEGSYTKDDLAVILTIREICTDVQFSGDVPNVTLHHEEGVDY